MVNVPASRQAAQGLVDRPAHLRIGTRRLHLPVGHAALRGTGAAFCFPGAISPSVLGAWLNVRAPEGADAAAPGAAAGEEKSPEVIKKGKEDADAAKAEAKK